VNFMFPKVRDFQRRKTRSSSRKCESET